MPRAKSPPKLPARGLAAFAVRMGLALAVGLLAGVGGAVFGDWPGPLGLLLTVLVNTAAMGAALLICVWWWRGIDEAAREAHKWAWWWGGCTGMAVGGVALMTALGREADTNLGGLSLNEVFASGVMVILLCQVIGYGIAWAVWWAKRR
jgi:hypothetical protein